MPLPAGQVKDQSQDGTGSCKGTRMRSSRPEAHMVVGLHPREAGGQGLAIGGARGSALPRVLLRDLGRIWTPGSSPRDKA